MSFLSVSTVVSGNATVESVFTSYTENVSNHSHTEEPLKAAITGSENLSSISAETAPTTYLWLEELSVGPDWSLVQEKLTWIWMLHIYGFACLFFMLAFYTFFSILNIRAQLSSRPFMSTINVFLCLLGISRAASFLIDPYNSKEILPEAIGAILWELGFPCLISAFGLIQLAFLQLTQLQIGPERLRSKSCLSLVISTHFFLTISSNILWTFHDDLKILCYSIQTVFCCWGTFLCVTFLYGGWQTMQLLKLVPPIVFPHSDSTAIGYENKGILQLGILAKCNNLASVAATVAAPALARAPKIRITDENEQSYSYISDISQPTNTTTNLQDPEGEVAVKENTNLTREKDNAAENTIVERERMLKYADHNEDDEDDENDDEETDNDSSKQKKVCQTRTPHRVRISSVPNILQNGPNTYMKSDGQKKGENEDDQVEMNLLNNSEICKHVKGGMYSDQTLTAILNHIAYVDQAMDDFKFDSRRLKPTRRSQIQKVLRATYLTAFLGFVVCILQLYSIFGPFGIAALYERPSPLPWFIFQTINRFAEFFMGCIMANITKQPVNRHHFPYSCHLHQRGNFY